MSDCVYLFDIINDKFKCCNLIQNTYFVAMVKLASHAQFDWKTINMREVLLFVFDFNYIHVHTC